MRNFKMFLTTVVLCILCLTLGKFTNNSDFIIYFLFFLTPLSVFFGLHLLVEDLKELKLNEKRCNCSKKNKD